jgi:hypothetical protein|tara:strand:+ start:4832 stop:5314 length:483 start_codon:yes stop_codon:yes gene_type:complete
MKYIAVTRFNNDTFNEYINFIKNTNLNSCESVINTPVKINSTIQMNSTLYVLEMNNSTNKIMGICKIINKNYNNQKIKVYDQMCYNRYSYLGSKRIDRSNLNNIEKQIIRFFDRICFKGKKHMKRGHGIQIISNDFLHKTNKVVNLLNFFENMFIEKEIK